MATSIELKAQAYDIFVQVEFLNQRLRQITQEIQKAVEEENKPKPEA